MNVLPELNVGIQAIVPVSSDVKVAYAGIRVWTMMIVEAAVLPATATANVWPGASAIEPANAVSFAKAKFA